MLNYSLEYVVFEWIHFLFFYFLMIKINNKKLNDRHHKSIEKGLLGRSFNKIMSNHFRSQS